MEVPLEATTQLISSDSTETQTATTTTHHKPLELNHFHSIGYDIDQHHHYQQQDHTRACCVTEAQLDKLKLLIKFIRNENYEEFLQLLEGRGFEKNLLNVFVDGQTALHYSLIYGRSLTWCKKLILNGASLNLTTRAGWHPIHLAAFNCSRETMRYLLDCLTSI